jgi:WD40 repeat protein
MQHSQALYASFSPDGRRVATASADGTARVWETATGKRLTPPLQHGGEVGLMGWVGHVGFSPDSRRLVSTSGVAVHVWDAGSGEPLTPPLKHGEQVWDWAFRSDDRRLITASKDQTLRVWSLDANDWPMEDLVLMGQLLTGRQIDDTGALVPLDQLNTHDNPRRAWDILRSKHPKHFTPAQ